MLPAKEHLFKYFFLCLIGALLYCVPVYYFIHISKYSAIWLLYLGNGLFLAFIFIMTGFVFKTSKPLITGHIITLASIILSCMIIVIIILLFSPGAFDVGTSEKILLQTPPGITQNNTHGMLLVLFANAVIGNFAAGSFATIITSQAVNQTES